MTDGCGCRRRVAEGEGNALLGSGCDERNCDEVNAKRNGMEEGVRV